MRLIVTYELNGISKITETDDLCKLLQGFWIDASGNFSQGLDTEIEIIDASENICYSNEAEIFIMPHMIKEIRKENKDEHSDNQD